MVNVQEMDATRAAMERVLTALDGGSSAGIEAADRVEGYGAGERPVAESTITIGGVEYVVTLARK